MFRNITNFSFDFIIAQNIFDIKLTFDPPWSFEKMTDKARAMLGL
jgi:metal-sulfur cluster biosynthetic enzyme